MLAVVELLGAIVVIAVGTLIFSRAPACAMSSPVVYNWSLATLFLYGSFGSLLLLVPILSVVFPLLALALVPAIATLVSLANWMSEAGKRGAMPVLFRIGWFGPL